MRQRIDIAAKALPRQWKLASSLPGRETLKIRAKGTPILLFFVVRSGEVVISAVRHQRENWFEEL